MYNVGREEKLDHVAGAGENVEETGRRRRLEEAVIRCKIFQVGT